MEPMQRFPAEVWEYLFEKVEKPQDWINFYRATSSFQGVVGKHKVNALLTKVLSIVDKYTGVTITVADVLQLRSVSAKWKRLVDELLEYELCKLNHDLGDHKFVHRFSTVDNIAECLKYFGNQPGNPFVGGYVYLKFPVDGESRGKYGNAVKHLLDKFGHRVRRLQITVNSPEGVKVEYGKVVEIIGGCVARTPYLVRLDISLGVEVEIAFRRREPPARFPALNQNFDYFEDDTSHLETYIDKASSSSSSPPGFRYLKYITFHATDPSTEDFSEDFQNAILKLHQRPARLSMAFLYGIPEELKRFPNLNVLKINQLKIREVNCLQLGKPGWPLKRLTLTSGGDGSRYPCRGLFEGIEHFKSTLVSLTLSLYMEFPKYPWFEKSEEDLMLNLPNLKNLVLDNEEISTLNPFIKLGKLESLRVFHWFPPSKEENQRVWTLGIESKMYKSNIWKMFPKLNQFRFHGCSFYNQSEVKFDESYERRIYEKGREQRESNLKERQDRIKK